MFYLMKSLIYIYFFFLLGKLNAYIYDKCDVDSNTNKILDSLNEMIRGEWYNVPVRYSNGSKINTNVMNWLSVPYAEPLY